MHIDEFMSALSTCVIQSNTVKHCYIEHSFDEIKLLSAF